jgi:two-component sensor histidine kinase
VPLGLILNEIVTNSIKYAFKRQDRNSGKFMVSMKLVDGHVHMLVKDDGEGFPIDFEPDSENVSLGIFLIKSLSEQIDGHVKFYNDGGACIALTFLLD